MKKDYLNPEVMFVKLQLRVLSSAASGVKTTVDVNYGADPVAPAEADAKEGSFLWE